MKTLAQYLAEYIVEETERGTRIEGFGAWGIDNMQEWIEEGIDAYQSTENCTISICGGECPNCSNHILLERSIGRLYTGVDEIEVCKYECPKCGYVVYR
ncbi:MAG: hypothetical protein KAW56_15520 [Candidatus Marinimicrobia bacterium]|nr:hypothetical protein [Candidatus Neomarinimicrobiota bacterium]